MFDRWPGDHGRKRRSLNQNKITQKSKAIVHQPYQLNNNSVVGPPARTSLTCTSSTPATSVSPYTTGAGEASFTSTGANMASHLSPLPLPYSAPFLTKTNAVGTCVPSSVATTNTALCSFTTENVSCTTTSAARPRLPQPAPGAGRTCSDAEQEIDTLAATSSVTSLLSGGFVAAGNST